MEAFLENKTRAFQRTSGFLLVTKLLTPARSECQASLLAQPVNSPIRKPIKMRKRLPGFPGS